MRTIFLIAGHGGTDTGATSGNYIERDLTIQFRDLVIAELGKLGVPTKTDANENALKATLRWLANKFSSKDILLDIHWNAGSESASGTEVFIPDAASSFEKLIGASILKVFTDFGFKNRGVKYESASARKRLGIMRPALENVLVEVCFITSNFDMKLYEANKYGLAKKLALVLRDYSNM